jgi:general stress protein YciG
MAGKSKRGFASMDPSRQREIASKGGKAAHQKGTAHEWSSEEARVAGRKGGEVVSRDRAHMAAIGREGGEARGRNSARARQTQSSAQPRTQGQGADAYSDRESPMMVSREGIGQGGRSSEESIAGNGGGMGRNRNVSEEATESSDSREPV